MTVKFIIRDRTGHSQVLVEPEQVEEKVAEYRNQGYLTIPYQPSELRTAEVIEVIPIAVGG